MSSGFLRPEKIHRPQSGLNPRTLDLEASTLPRDHRGRLFDIMSTNGNKESNQGCSRDIGSPRCFQSRYSIFVVYNMSCKHTSQLQRSIQFTLNCPIAFFYRWLGWQPLRDAELPSSTTLSVELQVLGVAASQDCTAVVGKCQILLPVSTVIVFILSLCVLIGSQTS